MTRTEIETLLESVYSKADYDFLFLKAEREQSFFNSIWDIAKEIPFDKSWRLLWILDHATDKRNDFILPILDELYQIVLATNNESYIRMGLTLILKCPIVDDYISALLDRCVVWMNDPKAKISSQVLGLEFFFRSCLKYPEMSPELIANINDMLERSPSAGYKHRLLKIRSKLEEMI
jgi:hypothetical protein